MAGKTIIIPASAYVVPAGQLAQAFVMYAHDMTDVTDGTPVIRSITVINADPASTLYLYGDSGCNSAPFLAVPPGYVITIPCHRNVIGIRPQAIQAEFPANGQMTIHIDTTPLSAAASVYPAT